MSLSVTTLSQYVRLRSCERFLRFRLQPEEEAALRKRWRLTIQPLTPLLQESGAAFEEAVEKRLAEEVDTVVRVADDKEYGAIVHWLKAAQEPVLLLQVPLEAPLGAYRCNGIADAIRLRRDGSGGLHVAIADVKSSRAERMEHRLQVALYAYLVRQVADREGVAIAEMDGYVLHAGAGEDVPTFEAAEPFDLATYLHVVERLALEPGCVVERVTEPAFTDVPYHLGYWCDGCLYNALCMVDSAERRDLSLVPHLTATEKRTLQRCGIRSLDDLAGLMSMPATGEHRLQPAPGREAAVQQLSQTWPLGATLPTLVQRARRALRRFDPTVDGRPFLYGSGFGTLPDPEAHEGLVQVFFDVQHDYLQDRLYLLAGYVRGPRGERTVVYGAEDTPTDDAERALIVAWIEDLLHAVSAAANGDEAYLHLYCYDTLDQRALLEGLKRHLDAVASVPGFFDLLTQNPALEQPVLSFLARELAERKNLGLVCTPLHDAARLYGFDWADDRYAYYDLFRARLFDNRRTVLRRDDGTLAPRPDDVPPDDPRVVPIESASRFNSQIPLEYAYGAWGHFDDDDDPLLAPFRRVDRAMLEGFAARRVAALAYLEDTIKPRSKYTGKQPFDLRSLARGDTPAASLKRSLEEFLHLEHHAALQARLQVYALPIDQRVQTGEALLLSYEGPGDVDGRHRFRTAFEDLGLDPALVMKTFRPREGSWMVLNPADDVSPGTRLKHGTLAVIEALGADSVELDLRPISWKDARFKYWHKTRPSLEPGARYTLDGMADDLNADKALEALQHTLRNTVYWGFLRPPAPRARTADEDAFAEAFGAYVDTLEAPHALTPAQRTVVQALPGDRALLVQGPPGTGKSHTLAWAVLGRLLEHVRRGAPFRVAVSCTTHKAILVALRAVLTKWTRMQQHPTPDAERLVFRGLHVAKIGGDADGEAWPDGLLAVDPYAEKERAEALLAHPYLILGATPGGLYTLARYTGRNKRVDWSMQPFDLLVVDEASQMRVPEAVLAGAFLKKDGALLVVGDHRQMPPIIAHDWETEEKRSVTAAQPYLSLFEYLLARDTPRRALDRSFRLHRRLADFLEAHIYRHDAIPFYSTRTDTLPACPPGHPFVDAVLDPAYPIVFVEHDEQEAQHFNELELALVAPLVETCRRHLELDGTEGLGVVVPHRAQRSLLQDRLPALAAHEAIDTVERFQGGERDVIIVSATASDPDFVQAEADFLLNANRLNVALSRPRKKLIVIASRSITGLLTSDLQTFEQALVWKRLYHGCTREPLWTGTVDGHTVRVRGCPA